MSLFTYKRLSIIDIEESEFVKKLIERLNFGKIKARGEMPHFLEFQLDSYEDFLQTNMSPNKRENKGRK